MRGDHKKLFCAVAVLTLIPSGWRSATAEIIVLKDGDRIVCRILVENDDEVTVRTAGGTERTISKGEIRAIGRESFSNVEIYEAVSERIPPDGGILAYYLGLWCAENGLDGRAPELLTLAAGSPGVAARAWLALAKLARDPGDRRRHLTAAVAADPTLTEAVAALREENPKPVDIPEDMLRGLADAIESLRPGSVAETRKLLRKLSRSPNEEARRSLSAQLFRATKFTLDDLQARLSRSPGDADGQDEAGPCKVCGGDGYVNCPNCKGKGWFECRRCKGSGVLTRVRRAGGNRMRIKRTCSQCKGTGGRVCPVCPSFARSESQTITRELQSLCRTCGGSGDIKRKSTSGSRRSSYSTRCRSCNGTGYRRETVRVTIKQRHTGIVRCKKCNRDGRIPLPGAERPRLVRRRDRRTEQELRTTQAAAAAASKLPFKSEELERIRKFARLLRGMAQGTKGSLWRMGDNVLLVSAAPPMPTGDRGLVFACGKWVSPSMGKLLLQRAMISNHKPRKVDLSEFLEWLSERELSYLQEHSLRVGRGGKAEAEVLGLVKLHSRAYPGVMGASRGALSSPRVYRVIFAPGTPEANRDTVCRWSVAPGGRELSFVLLSRPSGWPALEVVVASSPAAGLDISVPARVISRDASLKKRLLSLYFRVRNPHTTIDGKGDSAKVRVRLEVEVCALGLGSSLNPVRVWIGGIEKLSRPGRRSP